MSRYPARLRSPPRSMRTASLAEAQTREPGTSNGAIRRTGAPSIRPPRMDAVTRMLCAVAFLPIRRRGLTRACC